MLKADVQGHQPGQPHDRQVQAEGDGRQAGHEGQGAGHGDLLEACRVVAEGVPAVQEQGDGEAQPHDAAREQPARGRPPGAVPGLDHLQGQPRQRKDEALVLHPLAAEQHPQAEQDAVEHEDEGDPRDQGRGPGLPGDGHAPRQALVEQADRLGVGRRQPAAVVRHEEGAPVVLGRGVVEGAGDDREEGAGEARGHHHRAGQHHHVDDDQLRPAEGQPHREQAQDRLGRGGDREEQEDGDDGDGVAGQLRALDDQDRPGADDADGGHQQGPGEHRPGGDPLGGPVPVPGSHPACRAGGRPPGGIGRPVERGQPTPSRCWVGAPRPPTRGRPGPRPGCGPRSRRGRRSPPR